jgi:hypothetical protein
MTQVKSLLLDLDESSIYIQLPSALLYLGC